MAQTSLKMRLLPRAEQAVRAGHPWVFAESIKEQNRQAATGETAIVYDRQDRMLALGFYDALSPIRLRIFHRGPSARIDRDWWLARVRHAVSLREAMFADKRTDAYRWIHGENDGFPGLVADRYADTLVVKLYSAVWLPRWAEIEGILREVIQPRHLVLRMSRNLAEAAARSGLSEGYRGEPGPESMIFRENGILFQADVLRGQKTGFFLDQRDNRMKVQGMARDREVLNLFSFSGGFSLHAARGGATRVVDVDISDHALESARRNFELNPLLHGTRHERIRADVFDWLKNPGETFDLVITDPPSLAKRERDRAGALAAYRRVNAAAIRRVRPGGVLLAASCSAHVGRQEFLSAIRDAARASSRVFRECWTSGHAADHPAIFAEAEYLKAVCLEFG